MEIVFDCSSGISGDRLLAAFVGLGADARKLHLLPRRLGLPGVSLSVQTVDDGSIAVKATLRVELLGEEPVFSYQQLVERVCNSGLSTRGCEMAVRIIRRLIAEEARTIGIPFGRVLLSGEAAVEALITTVGGIALWADLQAPRLTTSTEVAIGGASSPSVDRLLDQVPTLELSDELQLTTPAAAAFLGHFWQEPVADESTLVRQAVVPMGFSDGVFRGQLVALLCESGASEEDGVIRIRSGR